MSWTGALEGTQAAPRSAAERKAEPPWRKPLLAIHIVASVGVLGADLVLLALGISGARGADPETVYPAMSLVSAWLIAPLAVLALGTGLLQAVLRGWGLARYWWVTIKLTITAVLTGVVLFVLVPGLRTAAETATGLSAQALLDDAERLVFVIAPSVAITLLLLNVVLAIYKPTWRIRSRPSA
jgi:hypothetical protein